MRLTKVLRCLVGVALLVGLTACTRGDDAAGRPHPSSDHPLVLAGGSEPSGDARVTALWSLQIYFDQAGDFCLALAVSHGRTSSQCGPESLLETWLPRLHFAPQAEYEENATYIYGAAWEDVDRVRVDAGNRDLAARVVRVPGFRVRFFALQAVPRLQEVPEVVAFDEGGKVLTSVKPSVGGSPGYIPRRN
ncbi:MAG: hypothetical protein WDA27_12140 [Actinomycetota bacterium]